MNLKVDVSVDIKEDVTCFAGQMEIDGRKVSIIYVFLVDGMLIDTGPKNLEAQLIDFYHAASFDVVALTHSHEDHTGTASWIQEHRKVPIYIHPKGIEVCAEPCSYPKYRQITWGIRKEFHALPLQETIQSRSREWKVIYTPGHADDHVTLLDEQSGILFSGDLFLSPKTKVIMASESIPVIMDSIRTLLRYDFKSMFCCHAGFIQDGKGMLQQKLDYLENLCGEVMRLHEEGFSAIEIDKKLFPNKYPIYYISDGEWDSLHIVTSIISHFG